MSTQVSLESSAVAMDASRLINNAGTEHCLHMLMDAVMCQGDTTVLTMKWEEGGARPIGNLTSPHECVNWDRLMEWVVPNSVDVFADGVLVHPKYGMLFTLNCAVGSGEYLVRRA